MEIFSNESQLMGVSLLVILENQNEYFSDVVF